jgi:hypothetical protein
MAKSKKNKIVLEIDANPKKELRFGASAKSGSDVKSKDLSATTTSQSNNTGNLLVGTNTSSNNSLQPSGASGQSKDGIDIKSVTETGNATKDESKRPADILIQHKFK